MVYRQDIPILVPRDFLTDKSRWKEITLLTRVNVRLVKYSQLHAGYVSLRFFQIQITTTVVWNKDDCFVQGRGLRTIEEQNKDNENLKCPGRVSDQGPRRRSIPARRGSACTKRNRKHRTNRRCRKKVKTLVIPTERNQGTTKGHHESGETFTRTRRRSFEDESSILDKSSFELDS